MSFSHSIPTLAPDERSEPSLAPRVWAGAILMVGSFGFFFLAGCFAIGILVLLDPASLNGAAATSPPVLSDQEATFLVTLYVLIGLSVLASGFLFFVGLVGLVRILYGKTGPA
jgi:hypothetical protein